MILCGWLILPCQMSKWLEMVTSCCWSTACKVTPVFGVIIEVCGYVYFARWCTSVCNVSTNIICRFCAHVVLYFAANLTYSAALTQVSVLGIFSVKQVCYNIPITCIICYLMWTLKEASSVRHESLSPRNLQLITASYLTLIMTLNRVPNQ